jgi:hypothetical protein
VTELELPGLGLASAEQRLEEGRLARAVRADQPDVLAALHREGDVRKEGLVSGCELDAFRFDHDPSAAGRLQEVEAEALRAAGQEADLAAELASLLLEAADVRQLRLRALGEVLLVAEALHEALEAGDVDVDALCLGRRCGEACCFLAAPVVPGAGEVCGAAGLQLEHGSRHGLEEPAVVRDEDHGRVDRLELALEPFEAGDVEVVGRLVEEEQVGVAAESAGERGARQFASREGGEGAVEVGRREAEVARDRVEALAPGIAACVLEARLGLGVEAERRRLVVAGSHGLFEAPQLLLRRREVGGPG